MSVLDEKLNYISIVFSFDPPLTRGYKNWPPGIDGIIKQFCKEFEPGVRVTGFSIGDLVTRVSELEDLLEENEIEIPDRESTT